MTVLVINAEQEVRPKQTRKSSGREELKGKGRANMLSSPWQGWVER